MNDGPAVTPRRPKTISKRLLATVGARLRENQRIRRTLPVWGRIAIDRQLPFLCVYRHPVKGADPGTYSFATSEASYLLCSAQKKLQPEITDLVRTVAEVMIEKFGAFLILELWAGPGNSTAGPVSTAEMIPRFEVLAQRRTAEGSITDAFGSALSGIKLDGRKATVATRATNRCCPKGMRPVLPPEIADQMGCHLYGLEIAPIYQDPESGEVFPRVLRVLSRRVTVALRRAFFDFTVGNTTHRPPHFHALGRRAVIKALWDVDRMLAESSEAFDFLLQVTPVNGEQAWHEFERKRFEKVPSFHYRPLPAEPLVLKRDLFRAPVERIEDPALAMIFREKLDSIERQITMLQDRNTPRFLHESIQQYGGVEDELFEEAVEILRAIPPKSRDGAASGTVTAEKFAERAREEIEYLRQQLPELEATVELRPDVTGLMVSRGNLLVSARSRIPISRVEALIQHEVGTHVLTYHNGKAQRLRHLYTGLAGYDALQEGLAVLSEYLVGGLSKPRLRLLAARVVAARSMIAGATFVECFRELGDHYGFNRRTAFVITMRTYRGGGLTKDAVYLRGLGQILKYLATGGELKPLFIGKIAVNHIPIVRELRWRGVLREPPLAPRYMNDPEALERLLHLQGGVSVIDLLKRSKRK
ncbi:MAG: DUF1704 domain-containing protein [Acidobacteriota bacterium]|nr:DUF1704 domain-containing protein [Acidobacteriota bacterium]